MDGWPDYWPGLPPMWYATHCVSPCLAILGKHAESVVCHGSGRIREELIARYGSPFAIETATFKIKDTDVVAEVTRSLFDTARQYRESFDATGSAKSFEWQQVEGEDPVIHTKSTPAHPLSEPEIPRRVKVPDYAHLLPEGIRRFTQPAAIQDAEHLSFLQGGGHGGSHPHLVHAFLSAVRGRAPGPARRRDLRQLDHGRPLRPRVGHAGRRPRRHPDSLNGQRPSASESSPPTP